MPEGDGTKYGKYVMSDLICRSRSRRSTPTIANMPGGSYGWTTTGAEGAFHMNTAWYLKAGPTLEDRPHVHDTDEIIGFFGSDSGESRRPERRGGDLAGGREARHRSDAP